MPKPFSQIVIPYTPKWGKNRERERADQFVVNLRDFPEREKLKHREELAKSVPDGLGNPREQALATIEYRKKDLEVSEKIVIAHVASVENLQVEMGGDGEAEKRSVDIKTGADIVKYCPALVIELSQRIFNGADEEELKNSR